MTAIYLGGFLSGIWPGLWKGARLLPLVVAVLLVFVIVVVPWLWAWGAVALAILVTTIFYVAQTRGDPSIRFEWKLRIVRTLYDRGLRSEGS